MASIDMDNDWMNDRNLSPVQTMLIELYIAYQGKTKKRRVQDKEISKRIGIPPTTWEGYVHGERSPSLQQALLIADAFENLIDIDARGRWLKTVGFPDYVIIRDPMHREIYRQLPHVPRRVLEVIHELATNPDSLYDKWQPPKDGKPPTD